MDRAWFLLLNGLSVSAPVAGTIAVIVSTYGPVCYAAILAWLWWRGSARPLPRGGGRCSWPFSPERCPLS